MIDKAINVLNRGCIVLSDLISCMLTGFGVKDGEILIDELGSGWGGGIRSEKDN